MKRIYFAKSPKQTQRLGEDLAKEILKMHRPRRAAILALKGDLGGGKTSFLQGFAKGLGIKQKILSPTFVLIRKLKIPGQKSEFEYFYHIDCYRVQKTREISRLGFGDMISDAGNIVAIEWGEKIKDILPRNIVRLNFSFIGKQTRKIIFN